MRKWTGIIGVILLLSMSLLMLAQDESTIEVCDIDPLGLVEVEWTAEDIAGLAAGDSVTSVQDMIGSDLGGSPYGIASFAISGGLEADNIEVLLFGDAVVTNEVRPQDGALPTVNLSNSAGYTVNLRGGPGTNFALQGTMATSDVLVADGRSADGQWLQVQTDTGTAWVFANLVTADGDVLELRAVDTQYTTPLQAFTLTTTQTEACTLASSGLLVNLVGHDGEAAKIQVNGVDLSFSSASLLLQAYPNEALSIHVINGFVDVIAENSTAQATAGQAITVALDENGQAIARPQLDDNYDFAAVGSAPIAMLDMPEEAAVCVVGIGSNETAATLYGGPGDGFAAVRSLQPDAHLTVTGTYTDADSQDWWKLGTGVSQSWVLQSDVRTVGICGNNIAEASPPIRGSVVTAITGVGEGVQSLLPPGQTVWQAESGPDVMTGNCTGSQLAICSHLTAVTVNPDGSVSWRGQEPVPFTLAQTGPNTYFYQGRNFQNNGTAILELIVTSEASYSLNYTTIFDNDPECRHTFYYTATPRW